MTEEELAEFIAAIPELTHHSFIDYDGGRSTAIHGQEEVAKRAAAAILQVFNVVPLDHLVVRGELVGKDVP